MVAAVSIPVSADIESGFGATPAEVADTVAQVITAGAVGINIEDAHTDGSSPLRPVIACTLVVNEAAVGKHIGNIL